MYTIIAIDVSKRKLDIYHEGYDSFEVINNSEKEIIDFIHKIEELENIFIVFEATAGYERLLFDLLLDNQIKCTRFSGKRVRNFAKSQGKAKTDKLDAKMIALYAKSTELEPYKRPDDEKLILRELNTRRRQILHLINQETNRLEFRYKAAIPDSINKVIEVLNEELEKIEKEIQDLIDNSNKLQENLRILTSIPGIADISARTILAELPELGSLSKSEVASLGGLAPKNYDSGTLTGYRFINKSRSEVKNVLYMCSMCARQHNKRIRKFFTKLKEKGKPGKLALVACMRKLLIYMNYMIKNRQTWNENFI